ncbi:hypothetical protein TNCV_4676871 [Trichonephila clavipes]|nr:hypothetical protein TNCV_4676871 [Trichonephila clavipes]
MLDHRIFQRLHRQLRETRSFHVPRHDAGRRRTVPSPSLEESILNAVADRPESSTRAVDYPASGIFSDTPPSSEIFPCNYGSPVRGFKSHITVENGCVETATAGSDIVQSGRPIFDDFFQHLWPYIGNNTANVVFQMVKRLWLIRIDQ